MEDDCRICVSVGLLLVLQLQMRAAVSKIVWRARTEMVDNLVGYLNAFNDLWNIDARVKISQDVAASHDHIL
jgi:hypothetical protein